MEKFHRILALLFFKIFFSHLAMKKFKLYWYSYWYSYREYQLLGCAFQCISYILHPSTMDIFWEYFAQYSSRARVIDLKFHFLSFWLYIRSTGNSLHKWQVAVYIRVVHCSYYWLVLSPFSYIITRSGYTYKFKNILYLGGTKLYAKSGRDIVVPILLARIYNEDGPRTSEEWGWIRDLEEPIQWERRNPHHETLIRSWHSEIVKERQWGCPCENLETPDYAFKFLSSCKYSSRKKGKFWLMPLT